MSPRRALGPLPAVAAVLAVAACAAPSEPADPAEVADAAARWGAAPQHVLTTSAEGFEAVPMAAGAYGADGFSLAFSDAATGSTFLLTSVGGTMTAEDCADGPLTDTSGGSVEGAVTCAEDGELLHRTAGEAEEYVVVRDGSVVRVSGTRADHDALREAAEGVRVPTSAELTDLVAEAPPAQEPVERGDLPPGDGAPDNSVGVGG
ncbi:hypothetical protein M1843_08425 [Isoptericola sp. 4D.3]|uniref:DUF306 domain-containing protein n=1 Tax=Isoptericola peretonis TaxID=2918523 RepID=A0ABT0J2P0_9MICO|nr:hypothetical protein [Isoptericola sp. 4D.3]